MEYKLIDDTYVVKISRRDNVMESLKHFVNENNILFAKISAIGAIEEVTIGYLQPNGDYLKKEFSGDYELVSFNGSVAGDKQIHVHISMAGKDFITFGGHLFDAKVSGVIEMFVTPLGNKKIGKFQNEVDLFPTWKLEE